MLKKIVIATIIIVALVAIFFLFKKTSFIKSNNSSSSPVAKNDSSNESPKIISTKPDPLDNNIVSATEIIEITFNKPLENIGEFKVRLEPETEFKAELSGDRKTAKITPTNPYKLGATYTLFIGPETKFDGVGRWGEEKVFHFRTIKYSGV